MLDALAGLHAAHELRTPDGALLGLVHRDISPQNLIVDRHGITRVTDFGVARVFSSETTGGGAKGKLQYMSPEQLRAEKLDRRSDVFAAAVVLWEALAHRHLFDGKSEVEIINSVLAPVRPVREVLPSLPMPLANVLDRALAHDRALRFPTANAMAAALEAAAREAKVLASTESVVEWVDRLAGEVLASRTRRLEDALAGVSKRAPSLATSLTERTVPAPMPSAPPRLRVRQTARRLVAIVVAIGCAALVSAVLTLVFRARAPNQVTAAPASASTSAVSAASFEPATAGSEQPASTSSGPQASSSPDESAIASASTRRAPPPSRVARPSRAIGTSSAPASGPRYGSNPYGAAQ
jgi:serine/threonine-protein kinase